MRKRDFLAALGGGALGLLLPPGRLSALAALSGPELALPSSTPSSSMFALMGRRWGVVNRRVTVPLDPRSDD